MTMTIDAVGNESKIVYDAAGRIVIHIVERNRTRYWQVRQRLDEPDEEGRLTVMFIATDSNVIGRDPAYNIVQGRP